MRGASTLVSLLFFINCGFAQFENSQAPRINLRLSVLLFPTTPLVTLETMVFRNLTVQFESNFVNTHGVNLKYYLSERMSKSYLFTGMALVKNTFLRQDGGITFLPYAGYGYAHRFGKKDKWIIDSRVGLGSTTNADSNGFYPVIKTGIGRVF